MPTLQRPFPPLSAVLVARYVSSLGPSVQRPTVPPTRVLMERRCRATRGSNFPGSFGSSSWVPRACFEWSATTSRCDVVPGACGVCWQNDGGQQ
ncbi:hypothetical protein PISMIDRAFT_677510 [Pisolithus microcarpus 441]|uniref:Uncharacterized protein n=1 Tax=Pisolithus microcarpus 441 TaxID=765257 RepID=A0A0C9ZZM2_9AGAM|nr:hypothetical protein PISMIDRAFT_677510 [Pisolithus microcarpus 441]